MSTVPLGSRLGFVALLASGLAVSQPAGRVEPRFEDFPVAEVFQGAPAPPVLATAMHQRYRTRIRDGAGARPNFAGHYSVIRWGCGSNCQMMAIVDAKTGTIYNPPLAESGMDLYVNLDMLSPAEVDFKRDSSLMVLRNGCRFARSECGVYYFNWRNNKFSLVKRVLIDLTKEP